MNIPELIMIVAPNVGLLDETIRVGPNHFMGIMADVIFFVLIKPPKTSIPLTDH